MLVRALKTCFVDGGLRKAGTQFDWSGQDKAMAKHLTPVGNKPADKVAEPKTAPTPTPTRTKIALKPVDSDLV